jgi:hypothetical protein
MIYDTGINIDKDASLVLDLLLSPTTDPGFP